MVRKERPYVDKEGWIHCPCCGKKTRTKIRDNTVLKNFPVYCAKCRNESLIDMEQLHITISIEPDMKMQSQ